MALITMECINQDSNNSTPIQVMSIVPVSSFNKTTYNFSMLEKDKDGILVIVGYGSKGQTELVVNLTNATITGPSRYNYNINGSGHNTSTWYFPVKVENPEISVYLEYTGSWSYNNGHLAIIQ